MRFASLSLLLALSGCQLLGPTYDAAGARDVELGAPFTLRVGDTGVFSASLHLDLIDVMDSRCPHGAACVWEGEIALVYSLRDPRLRMVTVPDTLRGYLSPKGEGIMADTTGGYVLQVLNVTPYPVTDREQPSRVRLRVDPLVP